MRRRHLALWIGSAAWAWAVPAQAGRLEDAFRDFIERLKSQGQGGDVLRRALNLREVRTPVLEMRVDSLPQGRPAVAVFVTPACGGCTAALDFLRSQGFAHEVFDVSRSSTARDAFALTKAEGFPVVLVGARRLTGWNERLFQQAVADDVRDQIRATQGQGG